jgi:Ni/Fe-hydrogenase subunit HybB-like protein
MNPSTSNTEALPSIPYEEMLGWEEEDLEDALRRRAQRLELTLKSLKSSQRDQKVLPLLIGIAVMAVVSIATLIGSVFPEVIGRDAYSGDTILVLTLVSPFIVYGLYAIYSSYRSVIQRRELLAQYISEATALLVSIRHLLDPNGTTFSPGENP